MSRCPWLVVDDRMMSRKQDQDVLKELADRVFPRSKTAGEKR
ncbi:MAG: hypothetical protein AB7D05_05560 [Mangrovibacterium sp.]